ncbi:MAG: hypothetical protein KDD66_18300, partial [Bdellovibrionales bacterium]|nr:hypothetical protein [Bdellovibrionales bacterium]
VMSVLFFTFGKIVPPSSIGIRHNGFDLFGVISKGYGEVGLKPGLHWRIPGGVSDIILLPRGFQFIQFTARDRSGDRNEASLEIPTRDGSKVLADITLVVRLFDEPGISPFATFSEKLAPTDNVPVASESDSDDGDAVPIVTYKTHDHGGPRELIANFTAERDRQLQNFSEVAHDALKQHLAKLTTTDYYNPVLRERAALESQDSVNTAVAGEGMELWAALVRRYVYAEQEIDNQIFAKNLQDQQERLNAAKSTLAEVQAKTERESALWDAKIKDLNVSGGAQVQVIRSEGELEEAKKRAKGDLLVATATAQIDEKKADALNEIAGSDVYVARELATILGTLKGGVVSDLDPFDISNWVQKLTKGDAK